MHAPISIIRLRAFIHAARYHTSLLFRHGVKCHFAAMRNEDCDGGGFMGRFRTLCVMSVCLAFAPALFTQDAVPTEILNRTINIRAGNVSGSAFEIDRQGKVYLVTARHMVAGLPVTGAIIQVRKSEQWLDYKAVKIIFPKSDDVDIAVLATNETVPKPFEVAIAQGEEGPTMGQQVWFLGYPFEEALRSRTPNGDFPFIKRGLISAVDSTNLDAVLWYVDGFNNPGFSGGPIVYWDFKTHAYRIIGVVKGYRNDVANAVVNGVEVHTNVLVNSGILIGYSITHAIRAIDDDLKSTR
jgi:hypothetical protein